MDDLTGMDQSGGIEAGRARREAASKAAAKHHLLPETHRQPISKQLDLTGDRVNVQVRPNKRVRLDPTKKQRKFGERFQRTVLHRWLKQITSCLRNQQSIEILQIVHLCQGDRENFVDGWIDEPRLQDQILGSEFRIQGWLAGRKAQPTAIQVFSKSELILEIPINLPRPDVLKVIPFGSAFCNYGFRGMLNVKQLPAYTELHLQAVFPEQAAVPTAPVGLIRLRKYGF